MWCSGKSSKSSVRSSGVFLLTSNTCSNNNEFILSRCHVPGIVLRGLHALLSLQNSIWHQKQVLFLFYKWGARGSEKLNNLPKVTQTVRIRTGIWLHIWLKYAERLYKWNLHSFREQWRHTGCPFASVAWHLGHHLWQLDAHLLMPSVGWEWLMQWPHSTHICWKIVCWFLYSNSNNNNKNTRCLSFRGWLFLSWCINWVLGSQCAWGMTMMMYFL